jgi:hypothetical protein
MPQEAQVGGSLINQVEAPSPTWAFFCRSIASARVRTDAAARGFSASGYVGYSPGEKQIGWSEKLYAATEPADPYLNSRIERFHGNPGVELQLSWKVSPGFRVASCGH